LEAAGLAFWLCNPQAVLFGQLDETLRHWFLQITEGKQDQEQSGQSF
jgi:hypothetical protein